MKFFGFVARHRESVPTGPPPSAPPTGLATTGYGSPSKHRLSWVNGDASAYTRLYVDTSANTIGVALPGATSMDTAYRVQSVVATIYAVHLKNGQESSPVALALSTWGTT